MRYAKVLILLLSLVWIVPASRAQESAAAKCKKLESTDFTTIQDAPTQVVHANLVEAKGTEPAVCHVEGYVFPQVGFELGLPISTWNGNFFERGCGGSCGFLLWDLRCPKGYACIASDMGHHGTASDGLWAMDLQENIDFGYRGAHVAAVAGKAITEHFYGKPPKHSYFMGCSTGGRQALVEAERFPWDFDGIIPAGPWIDDTDSSAFFAYAALALRGGTDHGKPVVSRADLEMVHKAVMAKCDMDDGVKDGVIGYPPGCKFDLSEVVCKQGQTTGCITEVQADAIRKVYEGTKNSKGEKLYLHGPEVGTESDWIDGQPPMVFVFSDGRPVYAKEDWALVFFRYMVIPPAGSCWKLSDFDFDRDFQRFNSGIQESLITADNPDLRKFKAAGGKLIFDQGWNDDGAVPRQTIDFYEMVERTMGGRAATQDFCRLFVVPGMRHCSGGDGAFAIDWIKYLDDWVDRGHAPDVMIGAHIPNLTWMQAATLKFPLDPALKVSFTRPVYPYPIRARYKGTGDPNDAANWKPVNPEQW